MLKIERMISKYNNSSRNGSAIKYIVLHYTGNKGDNAKNNAMYFGGGNRGASAHYFVSDAQIYQVVEDDRAAWSVGDGYGKYDITNANSINVEMCCWIDGNVSGETEANAVDLVKHLMKKHNINIDNVKRHYDASRKNCPNWSEKRWGAFKVKLVDNDGIRGESKLYELVKGKYLNYGDAGTLVYLAQSAMKTKGLYNGVIDGHYGTSKGKGSMWEAVENLNKSLGFYNDHTLGNACWKHILG